MEAKWIFPFMLVSIAFILLRAETTAAASNISISYQGCNQNKTCLSTPDKCDPAASGSCFFFSAGWPLNSTNITFELSGQSSGYIAVAFSVNSQLDNDSNIYACASNSGVKLIHTTLSNRSSSTLGNSSSEALVRGSVNGSTIQCVFTVSGLKMPIVNNSQLNISNIFLIKGDFTNGTLGTPLISFPINSTAGLYTVPSSSPSSTALGANNATTLGDNTSSNITTTTAATTATNNTTTATNNITTTTNNTNTTTTTNNTNTTINNNNNTNNNNTTTTTTTNNNNNNSTNNTTTNNNTNNNNTTTTTTTNNNNSTNNNNTNNTATTTNNTTNTTNNTNNTTTTTNTNTTINNNNNTNNNNTTTTTTTNNNNNNNTATTKNNNNNNNSGGSGNNALQSASAKAPLILIGAIVVALLSG